MRIRANSDIKALIAQIHEFSESEELANDVMAILDHMGISRPYRGGQKFLSLLRDAIESADVVGETQRKAELQDCYDWACGKLLGEDMIQKYDLHSDSGREHLELIRRSMSSFQGLAADDLDEFLKQKPNATVPEIQQHFRSFRQRPLRFVRARQAGHYGVFRGKNAIAAWMVDVLSERLTRYSSEETVEADGRVSALLELPDREALIAAAQLRMRREQLAEASLLVDNSYTKEETFQRFFQKATWIFGGSYIDIAPRRRFWWGTEVDLPLLRPDGVLHVVELKRANVPLVKGHRSFLAPSHHVNDAIAQVINYLRTLDEHREEVLNDYGVDTRRASGTIVIGHPQYQPGVGEDKINETLRTQLAHISRIDVLTYQELIDGAYRQLALGQDSVPEGTSYEWLG